MDFFFSFIWSLYILLSHRVVLWNWIDLKTSFIWLKYLLLHKLSFEILRIPGHLYVFFAMAIFRIIACYDLASYSTSYNASEYKVFFTSLNTLFIVIFVSCFSDIFAFIKKPFANNWFIFMRIKLVISCNINFATIKRIL